MARGRCAAMCKVPGPGAFTQVLAPKADRPRLTRAAGEAAGAVHCDRARDVKPAVRGTDDMLYHA